MTEATPHDRALPPGIDDSRVVKFRQLIFNWDLNVRKTYSPDRVARLVEQIRPDGIPRRPMETAETGRKNEFDEDLFEVLAGFTRGKAMMSLHGANAAEKDIRILIKRSRRRRADGTYELLTTEEKQFINMGEDESQEPVKNAELAGRVVYLIDECGVRQDHVAKRCFIDQPKVSNLYRCYKKLHPEIRAAWEKCPTRESEIPLATLTNWAGYDQAQQLIAFHRYASPPSELEAENDEEGEDDVEGAESKPEKPPILHKARRLGENRMMLAELKELKKAGGKAWTPQHEGALAYARWNLSDLNTMLGISLKSKTKPKKED
jgi:hypothetical protein